MNVKMTMKIGDETRIINEEQSKMFMGNDGMFQKFLESKATINVIMSMFDIDSKNKGKRIELITEFDDGQYVVIGRKPKEEKPEFGV